MDGDNDRAGLCRDRIASPTGFSFDRLFQLVDIDPDRDRTDGFACFGIFDRKAGLRDVLAVIEFDFVDVNGVWPGFVGSPVLGLVTLIVVLRHVCLADIEPLFVEHKDLDNDRTQIFFFLSQKGRQVVVHLGFDERRVGLFDPAVVQRIDLVVLQFRVRDVLRLDRIHDGGIGKPRSDVGDHVGCDGFDVRVLGQGTADSEQQTCRMTYDAGECREACSYTHLDVYKRQGDDGVQLPRHARRTQAAVVGAFGALAVPRFVGRKIRAAQHFPVALEIRDVLVA